MRWLLILLLVAQVSVAPLGTYSDGFGDRVTVSGVNGEPRKVKVTVFSQEKKADLWVDLDSSQWTAFKSHCEKALHFGGQVPKDGFVVMGMQKIGERSLAVSVVNKLGTRLVAVGLSAETDKPYLCIVEKGTFAKFRQLLRGGDRFLTPGKVP